MEYENLQLGDLFKRAYNNIDFDIWIIIQKNKGGWLCEKVVSVKSGGWIIGREEKFILCDILWVSPTFAYEYFGKIDAFPEYLL